MRTVFKPLFAAALLLVALPLSAQRSGAKDPTLSRGEGLSVTRNDLDKMRNQNQDKNSRQVDIYIYAASFSLIDSVLYVSDIQKLTDVTVNNKWFLKDRSAFEKQFTQYVSVGSDESQLTTVVFSEKPKKVQRSRNTLIKRNSKKNRFALKEISDFSFTKVSSEPSSN